MRFWREVMEDVDGCYSTKRLAFFVVLGVVCLAMLLVVFHAVSKDVAGFLSDAMGKLLDFEKYLGAFIASEQITKFAPKKDGA